MREIPATSDLPEGYRLDLLDDLHAPALRRQDGTVVAHFAAKGATREAIEREAHTDRFLGSRRRGEVVAHGRAKASGQHPDVPPSKITSAELLRTP